MMQGKRKPLFLQWLENRQKLEEDYIRYLNTNALRKISSAKGLVGAHVQKANSNLEFVNFLARNDKFSDWAVVGLYYAIYHASLALLAREGFVSKDHNATLCFLIKRFYKEISPKDLELINESFLTKDEIIYYAEARHKRRKASYSARMLFSKSEISTLRTKTITFLNKVKTILED